LNFTRQQAYSKKEVSWFQSFGFSAPGGRPRAGHWFHVFRRILFGSGDWAVKTALSGIGFVGLFQMILDSVFLRIWFLVFLGIGFGFSLDLVGFFCQILDSVF